MRISGIDTAIVSVPLDRPIRTPIHYIEAVDNVLVTVHTAEGVDGIAYMWTFGLARARVLEAAIRDLAQVVAGGNPLETGAIWAALWKDTNFLGHAGVSMFALSAIDIACWDIKGKALAMPLYRMLGGTRRAIPAYAGGMFLSDPVDAIVAEARGYVARGFKAIKMRTGAQREVDDVERVAAVRAAIGPDVALMTDVVQGWTPEQAIRMGHALAPFKLAWIEDPVLFDDLEGMARVAAAIDTPVCAGENDYSKIGFQRMIDLGAADILMPDLQRVGGISEWMKVAAMAEATKRPIVPHVFHEISVHMMASVPHGLYLEYVAWWETLFNENIPLADGMMTPPNRPGLGLEFAWDRLDRLRRS